MASLTAPHQQLHQSHRTSPSPQSQAPLCTQPNPIPAAALSITTHLSAQKKNEEKKDMGSKKKMAAEMERERNGLKS
jgi:hypothetical protein